MLTAFVELEAAICACAELSCQAGEIFGKRYSASPDSFFPSFRFGSGRVNHERTENNDHELLQIKNEHFTYPARLRLLRAFAASACDLSGRLLNEPKHCPR